MTDEQIMQQVREGNLDLAARLYDRYSLLIYNFFLRLSFHRELSQDLMQNVFFRMIKYRRSFKPDNRFRSWIFQVARNVYADHLKKNKMPQDNFTDLEQINIAVGSGMEDMEKAERIRNLHVALTLIPREHREVLILKEYQQLKYREIAEILDCSENTVKGRIHRALISLRKAYFVMDKK